MLEHDRLKPEGGVSLTGLPGENTKGGGEISMEGLCLQRRNLSPKRQKMRFSEDRLRNEYSLG